MDPNHSGSNGEKMFDEAIHFVELLVRQTADMDVESEFSAISTTLCMGIRVLESHVTATKQELKKQEAIRKKKMDAALTDTNRKAQQMDAKIGTIETNWSDRFSEWTKTKISEYNKQYKTREKEPEATWKSKNDSIRDHLTQSFNSDMENYKAGVDESVRQKLLSLEKTWDTHNANLQSLYQHRNNDLDRREKAIQNAENEWTRRDTELRGTWEARKKELEADFTSNEAHLEAWNSRAAELDTSFKNKDSRLDEVWGSRIQELETRFSNKEARLEEVWASKTRELEASFNNKETRLEQHLSTRERELEARFDSKETLLEQSWSTRAKELEARSNKNDASLEETWRSRTNFLEASFRTKEARLEETLRSRERDLEASFNGKNTRLEQAWKVRHQSLDAQLQSEWSKQLAELESRWQAIILKFESSLQSRHQLLDEKVRKNELLEATLAERSQQESKVDTLCESFSKLTTLHDELNKGVALNRRIDIQLKNEQEKNFTCEASLTLLESKAADLKVQLEKKTASEGTLQQLLTAMEQQLEQKTTSERSLQQLLTTKDQQLEQKSASEQNLQQLLTTKEQQLHALQIELQQLKNASQSTQIGSSMANMAARSTSFGVLDQPISLALPGSVGNKAASFKRPRTQGDEPSSPAKLSPIKD